MSSTHSSATPGSAAPGSGPMAVGAEGNPDGARAAGRAAGAMSVSGGAMLMVGIRAVDRLIGVASTLILARLLTPADFGIIAMASVIIELLDFLLDMGVALTLVQNPKATQRDYDVAWTLRLLQAICTAILICLAAPAAAVYFNEPRIVPVMMVLAIATVIAGLENIGVVSYQKELRFGMEFAFFFGKRSLSFVITVLAALMLHSYWALVIGTLSLRLCGVGLSYAMHPMRPRLNFSGIPAILSFSSWHLLRSIGLHLSETADRLLVGRRGGTALMGQYTLAAEIAAMPTTELLAPVSRVLLPAFVLLREDRARLHDRFLLALAVQALVGIPAAAGLALVAPQMVPLLLGEKWRAAVPFVQVLAATNVTYSLAASGSCLLLALGRQKIAAANIWLQLSVFAVLALALFPGGGALTVAVLKLVAAALGLLSFVWLLTREMPELRPREWLQAVWRPCCAAALMWLGVEALPLGHLSPWLQLLLRIVAGAAIFSAAVLILWRGSGMKEGAERYLLDEAKARWGRLRETSRQRSKHSAHEGDAP